MSPLAMTIVGLPLLAGALMIMASQRIRWPTALAVALAATGLTALLALALLLHPGGDPSVTIEWLPGSGPMGLATGTSSVYVVLVVTSAGFLTLLGTASRSVEFRPLSGAVTLFALAAANVAFLADHFLARYVALEAVALCVALAPLIEVRSPVGTRLASSGYLLLRVGDAGLLAAILILKDASGTLSIDPALGHALGSIEGAGAALNEARLGWVVAGFVLAVWAKLGGWPFHLWSQAGRWLPPASQAWLYATIVPNLGAYLLYRVTPLLALAGPLQTAALWLGAGGAALATLIALTQADVRAALVYVGAAQGGLALFVAAAGVKSAVWLGILALTPVRLLLFLAGGTAQNAGSARWRRVSAWLFGLGGLALAVFSLLTTWWAQELALSSVEGAGVPSDALFVAQAAVALIAVWTVWTAWRLSLDLRGLEEQQAHDKTMTSTGISSGGNVLRRPRRSSEETTHWTRWATVGSLGGGVLAGGLAFGPLVRHLVAAGRMTLPTLPAFPALLRYAATAPGLLAVLVLSLAAWWLQRRSGQRLLVAVEPVGEAYGLEKGLVRAAQVLRAVVEVGVAERIVALVVRAVVGGARAARAVEHEGLEGLTSRAARAVVNGARVAHRVVEQEVLEGLTGRAAQAVVDGAHVAHRVVEQEGLEGLTNRSAQAVVDGAHVAYRFVEQEGLEGILRRAVRIILALSRVLQRWHTGRLRRNLLWIPIALALAVSALVVYGW